MKKNYVAPVLDVEVIDMSENIIATSAPQIKMGDAFKEGDNVTADSKLFDEDFEDEEEW